MSEELKIKEDKIYEDLRELSKLINASQMMQQYAGMKANTASAWFFNKLRKKPHTAGSFYYFSDKDLKLLQGIMLNLSHRLLNISTQIRTYLEEKDHEKRGKN